MCLRTTTALQSNINMNTKQIVKPIDFALPSTLVTLGLISCRSSASKSEKNPGMPVHQCRFEILEPDAVTITDKTGAAREIRLAGKPVQLILCENDGEEWGTAKIVELLQKGGIEVPDVVEPLTGLPVLLQQLPAMSAIITSKPNFAVGPDGKNIIDSVSKKAIVLNYELSIQGFVSARPDINHTVPPLGA